MTAVPVAEAGTGDGRTDTELQKEISGTIGAQVHRLLETARVDTEMKIKLELKHLRDSMLVVDQRLDQMLVQLDSIEPQESAGPPPEQEAVAQLLTKIEQQWGQEIRALKQELHQTILAHNHNADLIKHHKDTIDAFRERVGKLKGGQVKTAEVQLQLQKLDARLKLQQKQRKLEPYLERLAALEQRVAALAAQNAPCRLYPGIGPPPLPMMPPTGLGPPLPMMPPTGLPVPPGMSVPPGIPRG